MKRQKFINVGYQARHRENALVTFINAVAVIVAITFTFYHLFFVWA